MIDLELLQAKAVLENARDAIVSVDASGNITHYNRAAAEMFGYEPEEVIGRNVSLLMPAPYRDEHDTYMQRYLESGEAKAIGSIREVAALRKNGERFPVELSVCEIETAGQPFYTAIIRDISTLRAVVEALRSERDFSERLIDTVPLVVLVLDVEGRIIRYNRYTQDLIGYQLANVRGKNAIEEFVPLRDRPRVRQAVRRTLANEPVRDLRVTLVARNGEERLISWSAELLQDGEGSTVGILAAGEDMTERLRAEEGLRRLEKLAREQERLADIGAIAAKLVHDLGNPLSGLSMQAQLLRRRADKTPGGAAIAQSAERIMTATGQLNELIRGIMDFAREQRLEIREVDLVATLGDIVAMWQPVAQDVGISVSIDIRTGSARVQGDGAKLQRVFDNLLKNAIEAIGSGPARVEVTIDEPRVEVIRVRVEDDGPGIGSGVDVFRLFETTKARGTGIGLAVAKQMVIAHGGSIEYQGRRPRGTVFTVELPVGGPHK